MSEDVNNYSWIKDYQRVGSSDTCVESLPAVEQLGLKVVVGSVLFYLLLFSPTHSGSRIEKNLGNDISNFSEIFSLNLLALVKQ